MTLTMEPEALDLAVRLSRADARDMLTGLGAREVRYLVDLYYQMQDYRTSTANQIRAAEAAEEPARSIRWAHGQMDLFERNVQRLMDAWSTSSRAGRWARSQKGIGPVLAAGCLATFDATKPTVGAWWRFAGLDPTLVWAKGQKRPYSARAKVLAWKIGDSFVKVSGREDAPYGAWYRERKAYELARDTDGDNADTARLTLDSGRIKDAATRKRYETGHLPDGRIDLRARRWVAKLFLSHLHWVMWEDRTGSPPPAPYGIGILGHAHLIAPPGWPME
jgi:hypothetical protein